MLKEQEIKKQILDYLAYQKDIYFFRLGSGLIKTEQGRYFKTGTVGCPDIVVLKNGTFIGLEVKTDIGKLSQSQQIARDKIERCGGKYFVVRRLEDAISALKL
jgi:hypothetical protein